jgi:biopolymer transport protein ExbD
MDGKIKNILNIVAIIAVILWLLNVFGVLAFLKGVPAPHVQATSVEMIG